MLRWTHCTTSSWTSLPCAPGGREAAARVLGADVRAGAQVLSLSAAQDCVTERAPTLEDGEESFLAPGSPLGLFVRHSLLGFDALSFEAACRLQGRCQAYCAAAAASGPGPGAGEGEEQEAEGDGEEAARLRHARRLSDYRTALCPPCPAAVERQSLACPPGEEAHAPALLNGLLASCGTQVERGGGAAGSTRSALSALSALAPDAPQAHALRLRVAMVQHDVPGACEGLHSLAEYLPCPAGADDAALAGGVLRGADALAPTRSGGFGTATAAVVCALTGLTGLHVREGGLEAALTLLDETVRTAQSGTDGAALANALGMLCQLLLRCEAPDALGSSSSQQQPHSQRAGPRPPPRATPPHLAQLRQLLKRCAAAAAKQQLPALGCWAHSALAQLAVGCGGPQAPALAAEAARASQRIAFEARIAVRASSPPAPPPKAGSNAAAPGANAHLFAVVAAGALQPAPPPAAAAAARRSAAASALVCATAWLSRGAPALAAAQARAFLAVHALKAPLEDVCLAHAHLAVHEHAMRGPACASAYLRSAVAAVAAASPAPTQRPAFPALRGCCVALAHASALARGELRLAAALCEELAALAPARALLDPHARLAARLAAARTRLACGALAEAAREAEQVERQAADNGASPLRVQALLLTAQCFAAASAPLAAMPAATEAASMAARLRLDALHAEATVLLCELHTLRGGGGGGGGDVAQGSRALKAALPFLLTQAPLEMRGRALLALARALLAEAPQQQPEDPHARPALLAEVAHALEDAAEALQQAHAASRAAEALHLLALVEHARGDLAKCDLAAERAMLAAAGPPDMPGGLACAFMLET